MATEYIVSGTLVHGGVEYADGTLFSTDDKTLEATLLRHGTLLTLEQYERQAEANNDVAARRARWRCTTSWRAPARPKTRNWKRCASSSRKRRVLMTR